jgi:hypothetical protein
MIMAYMWDRSASLSHSTQDGGYIQVRGNASMFIHIVVINASGNLRNVWHHNSRQCSPVGYDANENGFSNEISSEWDNIKTDFRSSMYRYTAAAP